MNPNPDRKLITLLFNPFVYLAGLEALVVGVAVILLAGAISSFSGTHFDGVLDTHMGSRFPQAVFLLEGLADWLCLALVLLIMGRIISQTSFRTIDVLGTQALARWPTVFTSLIFLPPAIRRFAESMRDRVLKPDAPAAFSAADAAVFLIVVALSLLLLCWTVALMYRAYAVSCNVRGGKAIGTFIAGLFIAEFLSKVAVYLIIKLI